MANFWDLPKPVREKIYRMHLVRNVRVKYKAFKTFCGCSDTNDFGSRNSRVKRIMPQLLQVSPSLEREASHIYFGENTFALEGHCSMYKWSLRLWPRHTKMIQSVILMNWASYQGDTSKRYLVEDFKRLASLPGLRTLVIGIREKKTLDFLLRDSNSSFLWHGSLTAGPQMYLQMLRAEGMAGLRSLRNLQHVSFTHPGDRSHRGSIRGGLLETMIKREIMQPSGAEERIAEREGRFRFLDLPPELRNTIYAMLLDRRTNFDHICALSEEGFYAISALSAEYSLRQQQVHREARALFYGGNDFIFATPMRLQAFTLSLGHDRLNCLRNVTFFYRKGATTDGLSSMDTILSTLRLLRGLRKLHILVSWPWQFDQTPAAARRVLRQVEVNPALLSGAKTLFSFRGLTDIKVLGPTMATRFPKASSHLATTLKRSDAAFEHFNYGLHLAQTGQLFPELYTNAEWINEEAWPALGTRAKVCGRTVGCICGRQRDGDEPGERAGPE